jgi:hypothetical protein
METEDFNLPENDLIEIVVLERYIGLEFRTLLNGQALSLFEHTI